MPALRYAADRRTLMFLAVFFSLEAWLWLAAPASAWLVAPIVLLACFFSFFAAVATHNTVHSPMFTTRGANRLAQVVLTLAYGHPVSAYVPGHNLSHHEYMQTRRDVMRTTKVRFRWNLLNLLFFTPTIGGDVLRANFRYFVAMRRNHPAWFRQLLLEAAVLVAVAGALLAVDWRKFLLFVLVPHQYAAMGIMNMNFLQHDGTDETHAVNHSRNFVGRVVNWFTFNNGFHGIHHMHPELHWSLLPEAHAREIAPFVHPALEQRSLLRYLFTAFVWPGKRVCFDGAPVVLPPREPDQDWIPAPNETPESASLGAIAYVGS